MRQNSQVVVVRLARRKEAGQNQSSLDPRGLFMRTIATIIALAAAICLGLTVGALVHSTITYLIWIIVGVAPWPLTWLLANLLKRPPKRDESVVVAVDQFREQTTEGLFGEPPPGSASLGWLTPDGLYTSRGRLWGWVYFTRVSWMTGRLKSGAYVHYIEVETSEYSASRVGRWKIVMLLLLALLAVAAPCLETWQAFMGLRHYGGRDDVLAAFAGAVAVFSWLAMFIRLVALRGWRPGVTNFVLLVNADEYPLKTVQDLIPQRLVLSALRR